jgi:hypothetical protein
MMNSNTRRTRPADYKADADVSDEYVWSEISYLDPEQKNGPSNSLLLGYYRCRFAYLGIALAPIAFVVIAADLPYETRVHTPPRYCVMSSCDARRSSHYPCIAFVQGLMRAHHEANALAAAPSWPALLSYLAC